MEFDLDVQTKSFVAMMVGVHDFMIIGETIYAHMKDSSKDSKDTIKSIILKKNGKLHSFSGFRKGTIANQFVTLAQFTV